MFLCMKSRVEEKEEEANSSREEAFEHLFSRHRCNASATRYAEIKERYAKPSQRVTKAGWSDKDESQEEL